MKAIKITGPSEINLIDTAIPISRPGYILVRVLAIALNPCDAKNVFSLSQSILDTTIGTDYTGIVHSLGDPFTYSSKWSIGDKIFGFVMGGNVDFPSDGAFAEYVCVKADVQFRVPLGWKSEDVAGMGVGACTAALGVCWKLGLDVGSEEEESDDEFEESEEKGWVFVYGGSTATGTMALQLLRLAGYKTITTCSPRNFPLVASYGAHIAFDYADPRVLSKITNYTSSLRQPITKAFDCISTPASARLCADVLANHPDAAYCSTLPLTTPFPKKKIIPKRLLLWSGLGDEVKFMGYTMPAVREDFVFLKGFVKRLEELLEDGEIRPHPVRVMDGGLAEVGRGLEELRDGRVSGEKLVYRISEE